MSTEPQVFIAESLQLSEERSWHEGEALAQLLRMLRKKPRYCYFRTFREFTEVVLPKFAKSGYRYFHLSCHGSGTGARFTLDRVKSSALATAFGPYLSGRRLFLSSCNLASDALAAPLFSGDAPPKSLLGPAEAIDFDVALAFWMSMYSKMFTINSEKIRDRTIEELGKPAAKYFEIPINYFSRQKAGKYSSRRFSP